MSLEGYIGESEKMKKMVREVDEMIDKRWRSKGR